MKSKLKEVTNQCNSLIELLMIIDLIKFLTARKPKVAAISTNIYKQKNKKSADKDNGWVEENNKNIIVKH